MPAGQTYETITTTTLSSDQTSFTLSSISSAYTDLRVIVHAIGASAGPYICTRFNGDTGSNYKNVQLYGNGTSALSTINTSTTFNWNLYQSSLNTNTVGLCIIDILSYSGSTRKVSLTAAANDKNGSGTVERNFSFWMNTSAINSITFLTDAGASFKTGTKVSLYGIKAA